MTSNKKSMIIIALLSFFVITSFAEVKENHELDIADFVQAREVSPFEMPTIALHYYRYDNKILRDATGGKSTFKSGSIQNFTLVIEKPVYYRYISYGFNFGLDLGVSPFTKIGTDTALSLRFRIPVNISFAGDISLTVSGNAGISALWAARAGDNIIYTTKFSDGTIASREVTNEARVLYLRFGTVTGFNYGIEYYPMKWLGFSLELQSKFYNYRKDQFKKNDITDTIAFTEAFNYSVTNKLCLSVKTTF